MNTQPQNGPLDAALLSFLLDSVSTTHDPATSPDHSLLERVTLQRCGDGIDVTPIVAAAVCLLDAAVQYASERLGPAND